MQPYFQVLLALLLAHVLGDFPLQTSRMVRGKISFRPAAYITHSIVHLVAAVLVLGLFTSLELAATATLVALALLVMGHLALDVGKSLVIRRHPRLDGAILYISDQAAHLVIVALAAFVAVQILPSVNAIAEWWTAVRDTVLVYLVVIAATVFPAGYLIRYLLAPLSRQLAASRDYRTYRTNHGGTQTFESLEGLGNAGLYLGWLERGLLVIAFALGSFTAVGLIIGAKSVARFPEFKSRAFAEYFLIGTLISVAIAAVGGWILRYALLLVR